MSLSGKSFKPSLKHPLTRMGNAPQRLSGKSFKPSLKLKRHCSLRKTKCLSGKSFKPSLNQNNIPPRPPQNISLVNHSNPLSISGNNCWWFKLFVSVVNHSNPLSIQNYLTLLLNFASLSGKSFKPTLNQFIQDEPGANTVLVVNHSNPLSI